MESVHPGCRKTIDLIFSNYIGDTCTKPLDPVGLVSSVAEFLKCLPVV